MYIYVLLGLTLVGIEDIALIDPWEKLCSDWSAASAPSDLLRILPSCLEFSYKHQREKWWGVREKSECSGEEKRGNGKKGKKHYPCFLSPPKLEQMREKQKGLCYSQLEPKEKMANTVGNRLLSVKENEKKKAREVRIRNRNNPGIFSSTVLKYSILFFIFIFWMLLNSSRISMRNKFLAKNLLLNQWRCCYFIKTSYDIGSQTNYLFIKFLRCFENSRNILVTNLININDSLSRFLH